MKTINEELYELYASKWEGVSAALLTSVEEDEKTPTHPLLLYVDDEEAWQNADLKVMIFGQETNDWENWPKPVKSIEHLRSVYDGFFNKGKCWSYGGFWNGIARFQELLNKKYPEKKIRYLWNNIVKVGLADEAGRPLPCMYDEIERDNFHVIPDEVNILKPNVLIFLTGPKYDDLIRENFGEVGYTPLPPFQERELARLSLPAAKFAFRTYLPRNLFMNDVNSFFNPIVDEIVF
jgi:hypothetical protein